MKYDGNLNIATGLKADSKIWKNEIISWADFAEKLMTAYKTQETYNQFISASKDEQSKIKDVGGYVGGFLLNGKRKIENIVYRQILTLDIDFANIDFWSDFTLIFPNAAVLHATHKHSEKNPRYRLVMPLSREVSPEEYVAIARRVAGDINIELFDNTTFDVNRLMFWPSTPSDVDYYCMLQDGPWLDADKILERYKDWHDTSEWPISTTATDVIRKNISKQEDPLDKKGIVGLFCRTYTIQEAIEKFIPDIYIHAFDNRYTYASGSTAAGLIVYDDKFAFSHHGTDPCGGKLCNVFDLIRIHKFGTLDIKARDKDKPDTQLPSYKAMEEFITSDVNVKRTIAAEKFAEAKFDFAELPKEEFNTEWTKDLEVNTKGEYVSSANNINTILQHDQCLTKIFVLNTFDYKRYVTRTMPWRKVVKPEPLRDVDYAGVRNYIESIYGIVASSKIDDALALEFEKQSYNPVVDYIKSLKWDKVKRVDTLLIDYFGAEDTLYTRAAIRKTLVGAIARVFNPGIKFDLVLTLVGGQGTGKSTFVKLLGKEWFSDTFNTLQGKEAYEQLQGAWLIELSELSGLRKAEVETIKQFISKCEDMFRPAYGRVVETYKRQCVFIGTTNTKDFLRDPSGNRRFMPIDIDYTTRGKSIWKDFENEIDNIWAEAYQLYLSGETLYLSQEEEAIAHVEQRKHSEVDDRRGMIEEYLNTLLPAEWAQYDIEKRKDWFNDPIAAKGKAEVERVYVCIAEVWCECLQKNKAEMSRYNTREINDILRSLSDWEFINSTKIFPIYGKQKYYARKID